MRARLGVSSLSDLTVGHATRPERSYRTDGRNFMSYNGQRSHTTQRPGRRTMDPRRVEPRRLLGSGIKGHRDSFLLFLFILVHVFFLSLTLSFLSVFFAMFSPIASLVTN